MMFLLHILALLYGLLGLLLGKLRTSRYYDQSPGWLLEKVETFYPESIYQPWQSGTTDLQPDLTRTYLINGGLVAYALYYLQSKHRG